MATGHTRYSPTGSSTWHNAQPVYRPLDATGFALGHNGNLTNSAALAAEAGMLPGVVGSDSDLIAELLANYLDAHPEADLVDALGGVLPRLEGAFSLVLIDHERLIGVRDPNGFRPLCLGRLPATAATAGGGGGWVLASETPALDVVGATFVRELDPGELLVIDGDDHRSFTPFPAERVDPKLCIFEFVYLARPGHPAATASSCTGCGGAWASCWPRRILSTPTW